MSKSQQDTIAALRIELEEAQKALREVVRLTTKGPVEFAGWSVVAGQAKRVAQKVLGMEQTP